MDYLQPVVKTDDIVAVLLFNCREALSTLTLFNKSLLQGIFPTAWKIRRVIPILKSGVPTGITNCRPISGLLLTVNF